MWTTMTALVVADRRRSTSEGSSTRSSAQSAKTGVAPAWRTANAVAAKVLVGTMTSEPATSSERRMISRAPVPVLTLTACAHPT